MIIVFSRCGNVFSPLEVINMYTDVLNPAIRSSVQIFCNTHERCMYMEVVQ